MISDRSTISALATLLSIPPIIAVAAAVNRLLPPPPRVPAVVAANDQRIDALHGHSKVHRDRRTGVEGSLAELPGGRPR